MSDHALHLLALVVAIGAGAVTGAWLARRGTTRRVRELQAYLEGWEIADPVAEPGAPAGAGADATAAKGSRRGHPFRPVFDMLEAHRTSFLGLRTLSTNTARRLQKLIDVSGDGVLLFDDAGRLLFSNGKVREMAGLDPAEGAEGDDPAILERVGDRIADSDVRVLVEEWLARPSDLAGRAVSLREGETARRLFATPHPIRSRAGERLGVLLLLSDVEALEQMRHNTESGVALDHLRLAAEVMAHRVRNPLNSIVLVVELIRRKLAGNLDHEKNLQTIQGEVSRLEVRLERFLELVRRRDGKAGTVDLVGVVEAVTELLQAPAREGGIRIHQQLRVSAARVHGDEVDLLRAVLGPCSEALRESPPGGELKLGLDSDRREHLLSIECAGLRPDSLALVVAEDLTTRSGGRLVRDAAAHPMRLTYRFRAENETEAPAP